MRAVNTSDLASTIEKLLRRLVHGHAGTRPDMLLAVASGNAANLAHALWTLVRRDQGALVGHEQAVVAMLAQGPFDAQDFLSLLRQLKSANLEWFEGWLERGDGLAYYGWSGELEVLLDKLLAMTEDRTLLEWADVSEPAGSALLFALGRRGFVEAHVLPPDALPRFATAFLLYGSRCPEQFAGWERLWPPATFARTLFACAEEAKEIGVSLDNLEPLIAYATPYQLVRVVEKLTYADPRALDWLTKHGKTIVPYLQPEVEELLRVAKEGYPIPEDEARLAVAVARIRAKNGDSWPSAWLPLAKRMLECGTQGVEDVLAIVAPNVREKLLLEHLANDDAQTDALWPLAFFPTPRVVEALVTRIRQKRKKDEGWYDSRRAFAQALGRMGVVGQAALVKFLDEPDRAELALEHLAATSENAVKAVRFLGSSEDSLRKLAEKMWFDLRHDERIELMDRHFDVLPPVLVARLLGHTQHHPRAAELARRLPDTVETHHWRELCLHPPDMLRSIMEAMAKTPREDIERLEKVLAPEFAAQPDYRFKLSKALVPFGAQDLPAILQVTARRWPRRRDTMWGLCKHFGASCPEVPWIAAFWWGIESGMLLPAAEALGEAFLPALQARIISGTVPDTDWPEVLQVFTKYDPTGGFDHFVRFADNVNLRVYVQAGVAAALQGGSSRVRDWLGQALRGKSREFALVFLGEHAVPEVLPILQALEEEKLPSKLKKLLQAALEAQRTRGSTIQRSNVEFEAHLVHQVNGPVEALRLSHDGQTLLAHSAGTVTVWRGEQVVQIENLGAGFVELSRDGRFVVVMNDEVVNVFEPWENVTKPRHTLLSGTGLDLVVPMPGGRVFTLSAAGNGSLVVWNLETGACTEHKLHGGRDFPAHVAWIDDTRYVVGTMEDKTIVRELESGKILGKLQSWADHDGGGVHQVAAGNGGKLVASLFVDGSLMIWDISGPKIKALGRHYRTAPRALAADPGSSWVVTPGTKEVLTWKNGQPARALEGSGPLAVCRGQWGEEAGIAAFVRPNVVAVGGQSVDVWDLDQSQHLGRWDKPVTAMVAALGTLFVGDTDGNIWKIVA